MKTRFAHVHSRVCVEPTPQIGTNTPAPPGGGATARCNDGTFSYAAHHQGACSSHGGVAEFYK